MSEPVLTLTDPGTPIEYRGKRSFEAKTVVIGRKWEVTLDGEIIGSVEYRMFTRESKTAGRMYVNSRWQSPGWAVRGGAGRGRDIEAATKADAVEKLLRWHEKKIS